MIRHYRSFLKGIKIEISLFEAYYFLKFDFRLFGHGVRFRIER